MALLGLEVDRTQEFLLNIPSEYSTDLRLKNSFSLLAEEQQTAALIQLRALMETRTLFEVIDLAEQLKEGELGKVIAQAISNIAERITFWRSFLNDHSKYKQSRLAQ